MRERKPRYRLMLWCQYMARTEEYDRGLPGRWSESGRWWIVDPRYLDLSRRYARETWRPLAEMGGLSWLDAERGQAERMSHEERVAFCGPETLSLRLPD